MVGANSLKVSRVGGLPLECRGTFVRLALLIIALINPTHSTDHRVNGNTQTACHDWIRSRLVRALEDPLRKTDSILVAVRPDRGMKVLQKISLQNGYALDGKIDRYSARTHRVSSNVVVDYSPNALVNSNLFHEEKVLREDLAGIYRSLDKVYYSSQYLESLFDLWKLRRLGLVADSYLDTLQRSLQLLQEAERRHLLPKIALATARRRQAHWDGVRQRIETREELLRKGDFSVSDFNETPCPSVKDLIVMESFRAVGNSLESDAKKLVDSAIQVLVQRLRTRQALVRNSHTDAASFSAGLAMTNAKGQGTGIGVNVAITYPLFSHSDRIGDAVVTRENSVTEMKIHVLDSAVAIVSAIHREPSRTFEDLYQDGLMLGKCGDIARTQVDYNVNDFLGCLDGEKGLEMEYVENYYLDMSRLQTVVGRVKAVIWGEAI